MGHKTKKVGIAGRFGSRYGVRIRKRVKAIEEEKVSSFQCPRCKYQRVRRTDTGIWRCRHCGLVFAGGAYTPFAGESEVREAEAPAGELGGEDV